MVIMSKNLFEKHTWIKRNKKEKISWKKLKLVTL